MESKHFISFVCIITKVMYAPQIFSIARDLLIDSIVAKAEATQDHPYRVLDSSGQPSCLSSKSRNYDVLSSIDAPFGNSKQRKLMTQTSYLRANPSIGAKLSKSGREALLTLEIRSSRKRGFGVWEYFVNG